MQHDNFVGLPIGLLSDGKFDDRMRRIAAEHLRAAAIPTKPDSPWYALKVETGCEQAVENALKEAGVVAMVPVRKGPEYRRRHRIIPAKMLPVMSGYVLVKCHKGDVEIAGLLGVSHVKGILGGYEKPHPMSDESINRFNRMATTGKCDWERPVTVFHKDQFVVVTDGPFAGFAGKVTSCRNDGRGDAVVEMTMFGNVTPTLIPLAILKAA